MTKKFKSVLAFFLLLSISMATVPSNLKEIYAASTGDYGVVGAYEAYSISKDLYEKGNKLKTGNEMIYVRSNPKGGTSEAGAIAYCFNADRSVPDIKAGAPDYIGENYSEDTLITYTKVAGTNNKFSSLATRARDNARENVLKIVYNGFRDV